MSPIATTATRTAKTTTPAPAPTGGYAGKLLRVNLSTGILLIRRTKNSKPRSVPMNGVVYETLITLEPDADRLLVDAWRGGGGLLLGR